MSHHHSSPLFDEPVPKRLRPRGNSLSGRLRSASDLCEEGVITSAQKGVLKDLIITGDMELEKAFQDFERGNSSHLYGECGCLQWLMEPP